MPLSDTQVRAAKPREKPYKLFDERGLFLLVQPNGGRWWRFRYRLEGKEKLISVGTYPDISLRDARERRDDARKLVAKGVDPSAQRQAVKDARSDSFEAIAREWLGLQTKKVDPGTIKRTLDRLAKYIFPSVGSKPIAAITAPDILAALRRIEARGKHETAHRVRAACGQVFRFAIATSRAERDPTADLKDALAPVVVKHHASVTDPKKIGTLLRDLHSYRGQPSTETALKLAPLVFVRPGELRQATWDEFDFKEAEWRIPKERMKMRRPHIVPLSKQAIGLLDELKPTTGPEGFVFPSLRTSARPMSNNTVNAALRSLGYSKDEMTGHGFRSMASTRLNERGFKADWIEAQLAHGDSDKVRSAYNYAAYLPQRKKMMQAWADYLDEIRLGNSK